MKNPHHVAFLIALLTFPYGRSLAQTHTRSTNAERQLLHAVNQERTTQGLAALRSDEALTSAARKHAEGMAEQGKVAHQLPGEPDLPGRARAAGAHFTWLSENVAQGPNVQAIHQSFMKSPLHRANILDGDMDSAGIGVAEREGELFVAEDFSKAK